MTIQVVIKHNSPSADKSIIVHTRAYDNDKPFSSDVLKPGEEKSFFYVYGSQQLVIEEGDKVK